MTTTRSKGIILQRLIFKEKDHILTILTPEGIIKLIFKGALSKKNGNGALTTPLQLAEFVYVRGRGDIAFCQEISIINPYFGLRTSLEVLECCGEMATTILAWMQPEQPEPLLYRLFVFYLEAIPAAKDPYTLVASLKLKILKHEGILALSATCSECQTVLNDVRIAEGECYCLNHAHEKSILFSEVERLLLGECIDGRSIKRLMELSLPSFFLKKVRLLEKSLRP